MSLVVVMIRDWILRLQSATVTNNWKTSWEGKGEREFMSRRDRAATWRRNHVIQSLECIFCVPSVHIFRPEDSFLRQVCGGEKFCRSELLLDGGKKEEIEWMSSLDCWRLSVLNPWAKNEAGKTYVTIILLSFVVPANSSCVCVFGASRVKLKICALPKLAFACTKHGNLSVFPGKFPLLLPYARRKNAAREVNIKGCCCCYLWRQRRRNSFYFFVSCLSVFICSLLHQISFKCHHICLTTTTQQFLFYKTFWGGYLKFTAAIFGHDCGLDRKKFIKLKPPLHGRLLIRQ